MDIIILFVLLVTAFAIWREAHRGLVLGLWLVALVLMIGLFRYHVTSSLGLSF
ncbi:DUF5993 family protein [Aestuariivirga litoralis]|uniref:DUF5993 family protein n=1 Tax=Aestuariivirga litoralis TaxID=2650924 RepID=UPI001875DA00|nr:DUF5993 family protein [Aestuariivirga litoralis]